jgi:cell division topological specificity factor
MALFDWFRLPRQPRSADTAKERLQILLAHERTELSRPNLLPELQRDIMEVILRHLDIEREQVVMKLDRAQDLSTLEINIELPHATPRKRETATQQAALQPQA